MSDYAIGPDVTASPPAPQGAAVLLRRVADACGVEYADAPIWAEAAPRLRALADAIEQITPAMIAVLDKAAAGCEQWATTYAADPAATDALREESRFYAMAWRDVHCILAALRA